MKDRGPKRTFNFTRTRVRTKIFHPAGGQCSFVVRTNQIFGPWIPGLKLNSENIAYLNILIHKKYNFHSKIDDATVKN